MDTVDGSSGGSQEGEKLPPHPDRAWLITSRALLIFLIAVGIGLLLGVSAGLAAGVATSQVMGTGVGVVAGIVAGLGAMAITTLSVAGMLHSMVGKGL